MNVFFTIRRQPSGSTGEVVACDVPLERCWAGMREGCGVFSCTGLSDGLKDSQTSLRTCSQKHGF